MTAKAEEAVNPASFAAGKFALSVVFAGHR